MPNSPTPSRSRKADLAADAWRRLLDYFLASTDRFAEIAATAGLTVAHARALATLEAETGKSMRTLADEWRCDASNVTFLVDRLERLGLVTRTASTTDRRVKTVTLTPEGARTRDLIQSQVFQPPPDFLRLSRAQLQAVIDAFETVAPTP